MRVAQPTTEELSHWREVALAVREAVERTSDSPRLKKAMRVLANKGKGTICPDGPPTAAHPFVRLQRRSGLWLIEVAGGRENLAAELRPLADECLARLDEIAAGQNARKPYRED